jgi:hypothetical protein
LLYIGSAHRDRFRYLVERCRLHIFIGHSATFVREQVGQLFRFGGWVTVTSFVGQPI